MLSYLPISIKTPVTENKTIFFFLQQLVESRWEKITIAIFLCTFSTRPCMILVIFFPLGLVKTDKFSLRFWTVVATFNWTIQFVLKFLIGFLSGLWIAQSSRLIPLLPYQSTEDITKSLCHWVMMGLTCCQRVELPESTQ